MPTAVSLSQMVDLSLGTPEIGSVNFNVMHTLLHAIIKKLSIGDHRAEINEHDRDFLATSKIRARSTLSDADSGRGEDSEDATSEKSGVPPFRPSPYHRMELKVEKLAQQLEELNQLPSNSELFDRTTKSKSESATDRPVADMWQYMQLKKRVDANEEGVGKLFSLIEDMMKEMKDLKDANKLLQDQLKGLNLNDLKKRLADLENITKELNEKFSQLPSAEEFSTYVTWPALEDALKGIRDDLTPQERVVIEMSSQTEPAKRSHRMRASRPGSSRPVSRVSTPGPSEQLLDVLERLGKLDSDHVALKKRVDDLEEEMKNKLDKSAIEGLGIPAEMLEQIGKLKEELDALAALREKPSVSDKERKKYIDREKKNDIDREKKKDIDREKRKDINKERKNITKERKKDSELNDQPSVSDKERKTDSDEERKIDSDEERKIDSDEERKIDSDKENKKESAISFLGSVVTVLSKVRSKNEKQAASSTDTDTLTESSDDEQLFAAFGGHSMSNIALSALQQRLTILEDRFKLFQENLLDDSAYQTDVADLTGWLAEMENRIAGNTEDITAANESDVDSGKGKSEKPDEKPAEKETKPVVEKPKKTKEDAVVERLEEEAELKHEIEEIFCDATVVEVSSQVMLSAPELQATNEKLKNLAFTLNEQLHGLRDKVFLVDHELKRMAKGVEFALMRSKVAGANEMDSDALTRAQQAILQLQAEVEKLHHTTSDIIEENKQRTKQIQDTLKYCDKLQEEKADKDYVQMEVDVKADKKALETKVNHKLFDKTTEEINNMIKEILDKLTGHDEDWKKAYSKLTEDIDGKLDRLELDPLKEWLEARLKALNDKLKKYQTNTEFSEDDAAGIRKQLIQRFHCISCDRPVDMLPTGPVPSLPSQMGLNPTKSPRPYTTFELDQIRQHAKRVYHGADKSAYTRHLHKYTKRCFTNTEVADYYATPRPCGGSHTLTYPHKRNTKLTHLSHLFREDEAIIIPATKEEVDIQGADGHIYRGRHDQRPTQKLEARFPTTLGQNNNNMGMNVRSTSPHPPQYRPKAPQSPLVTQQRARPVSARTPPSPRPSSAGQGQQQGSRPMSAKIVKTREQTAREAFVESSQGQQEAVEPVQEQSIQLEMPSADPVGN
ncbi:myosin-3-like isoform X3 [Mercenaria mercenaria]|uniref:myosin-3-like isoform X3 n=1 Tax=Mercenaria mercenaria TaxID=6596 RepID=UPI00234E9B2B|nr:myosin-3-like isoform X3 [Mercenaria mercenaria]